MRIGQKVRFVGNSETGKDNVFLTDNRLTGKIFTIHNFTNNGDVYLEETMKGFQRNTWLSSIFAPAIMLPSNIRIL